MPRSRRRSRPSVTAWPRAESNLTHSPGPPVPGESPLQRTPSRPRRSVPDAPRERLAALGAEALADAELLALLLRTGSPQHSARDVAQALLRRHGGLRGLARTPLAEL